MSRYARWGDPGTSQEAAAKLELFASNDAKLVLALWAYLLSVAGELESTRRDFYGFLRWLGKEHKRAESLRRRLSEWVPNKKYDPQGKRKYPVRLVPSGRRRDGQDLLALWPPENGVWVRWEHLGGE
jgi:hypothetical protein